SRREGLHATLRDALSEYSMGIYLRPDSKVWWLYLESSKKREPTHIPVGKTTEQRRASRAVAQALYHRRMLRDASPSTSDPDAKPDITFDEWACKYDQHVIVHHRGYEREREILKTLRAAFSEKPDRTPR